MDFLTSETCQNLARSFAGESQARTRYQLAAAVARREDLEVVARIFETAAANELAHAQEFLELLCKWNRGGLENLTISAGYPYVLGHRCGRGCALRGFPAVRRAAGGRTALFQGVAYRLALRQLRLYLHGKDRGADVPRLRQAGGLDAGRCRVAAACPGV